ncbi:LPXTG cell wall anchor domain-containing protein [Streptococcus merionis]
MNEPGRALPHTGGAGHQLILLVGTLLTGTALYGFYKRSSKKNA